MFLGLSQFGLFWKENVYRVIAGNTLTADDTSASPTGALDIPHHVRVSLPLFQEGGDVAGSYYSMVRLCLVTDDWNGLTFLD